MVTADVVVVGAGVIGCGTALELARRGLRVVVLDRNPGPGQGSTQASSAIVRFTYSTWAGVALAWEAGRRWGAWEEYLGHRDPDGLARFVRCGMVALDDEQTSWSRLVGLFDRAGIPYEHWDAAQLVDALPGIDPGRYHPPKPVRAEEFFAPARGVLGAWYTPDAGYVTDPQRAAANLATAAASRGADLRFRSTVCGLVRSGGTWRVDTTDGPVSAPVVVNAAGPWSRELNRLAGAGADFAVQVRPMRQEVHHVPAPPGLADRLPFVGDLDLGVYLRPEVGGLLVGGTEPECDPLEWIEHPDDADPRPSVARFEAQVTRAARRFPELRVPGRPSGVVGVYDVSSDWLPIYDRTAQDGYYVAIGTSGNQFKNAPVVGELMAELVLAVEGGHDHDQDPLTFTCSGTGHVLDVGTFSRRREANPDSSGTVMG
jgi:glycine/D-amino acid oxidase-like deaminating enzyme